MIQPILALAVLFSAADVHAQTAPVQVPTFDQIRDFFCTPVRETVVPSLISQAPQALSCEVSVREAIAMSARRPMQLWGRNLSGAEVYALLDELADAYVAAFRAPRDFGPPAQFLVGWYARIGERQRDYVQRQRTLLAARFPSVGRWRDRIFNRPNFTPEPWEARVARNLPYKARTMYSAINPNRNEMIFESRNSTPVSTMPVLGSPMVLMHASWHDLPSDAANGGFEDFRFGREGLADFLRYGGSARRGLQSDQFPAFCLVDSSTEAAPCLFLNLGELDAQAAIADASKIIRVRGGLDLTNRSRHPCESSSQSLAAWMSAASPSPRSSVRWREFEAEEYAAVVLSSQRSATPFGLDAESTRVVRACFENLGQSPAN